ncbi:hypothetical protein AOLI_G00231750 [Acnodon oligacanthus]
MQYAADLRLIRVDIVFEFPRPSMPNLVYIGGFQCRPARELPSELEAFMQSSGEARVVLMSLGTFITALPKESDLLGHPKTRAFVAHGGTNGLYEAVYHGVPVLGLPLLFDQLDNVVRLEARGAARVLDAATLRAEGFLEALREISENPSYRLSMQKLSRLHRDQPMHCCYLCLCWPWEVEKRLKNRPITLKDKDESATYKTNTFQIRARSSVFLLRKKSQPGEGPPPPHQIRAERWTD